MCVVHRQYNGLWQVTYSQSWTIEEFDKTDKYKKGYTAYRRQQKIEYIDSTKTAGYKNYVERWNKTEESLKSSNNVGMYVLWSFNIG